MNSSFQDNSVISPTTQANDRNPSLISDPIDHKEDSLIDSYVLIDPLIDLDNNVSKAMGKDSIIESYLPQTDHNEAPFSTPHKNIRMEPLDHHITASEVRHRVDPIKFNTLASRKTTADDVYEVKSTRQRRRKDVTLSFIDQIQRWKAKQFQALQELGHTYTYISTQTFHDGAVPSQEIVMNDIRARRHTTTQSVSAALSMDDMHVHKYTYNHPQTISSMFYKFIPQHHQNLLNLYVGMEIQDSKVDDENAVIITSFLNHPEENYPLPAEKCGAIDLLDRIVNIHGIDTTKMQRYDVVQTLKVYQNISIEFPTRPDTWGDFIDNIEEHIYKLLTPLNINRDMSIAMTLESCYAVDVW